MYYVILLLNLPIVFIMMYGIYKSKLVFGGNIWGINIPMSSKQKAYRNKFKAMSIIGIILFVVMLFPSFPSAISILFSTRGSFGAHLLFLLFYCVLWFAAFFLAAKFASKDVSHNPILTEETNALVLENLPFVQSVEEKLPQATSFVVSFEGIALVNQHNYCFDVIRYGDYQLGELSTPQEVALIGMYFVQKYHRMFQFSVDFERIPGQPGQMVSFIGPGGIYVGHTSGTAPQAIFKSYIFYRLPNAPVTVPAPAPVHTSVPTPTPTSTGHFCGNCGAQNNAGAKFCTKCGKAM